MILRISSLVSYAVLAIFVVYLAGNLVAAETPLEAFPDAVAIVTLGLVPFAFVLGRPLSKPEVRKFCGLYAAYLILLLLSSVVSGNPGVPLWQSFGLDLAVDSKPFVFAFMLLVFLPKPDLEKFFKSFLLLVFAAGALNLLFIIHDLFSDTNAYGIPLQQRSGLSVPTGFLNHKTKSAQLQLIATIAGLAMLRGGITSKRQQLVLALTVGIGLSIAVHLSVKEIASAIIALILFFTLQPGRRIGRAATFAMLLTGLATVALTFESPVRSAAMNRIDIFLGERGAKTVRTVAYPASVSLANEHFPLGTGASTFMSKGSRDLAYSPYYVRTGISGLQGGSRRDGGYLMDAFWPKILAQTGYLGLFAFLALILWPIARSLKTMQIEAGGGIFASAAIMISLAIASLAAPVYTDDHLMIPFAAALAYALRPRALRNGAAH